jgi:hypothetical protein
MAYRAASPVRRRKVTRRPGRGEGALELVGPSAIDPESVADSFGISKGQLAEATGISRETLYKRARSGAPRAQARLQEMIEILHRVSAWAGGGNQAMAWYRAQPLAAFGGRTAEALVKSGDAAKLRDYLDHLALGGYA